MRIKKCQYTIIVAYDKKYGLAKNGQIPWDLPFDRSVFRFLTDGLLVVFGRRTFETLKSNLKNREIIILSKQKVNHKDHKVFNDFSELNNYLKKYEDVIIAGGEEIYKLFIPKTCTIIATEINADFGCDQFFPKINFDEWDKSIIFDSFTQNNLKFNVVRYDRKS